MSFELQAPGADAAGGLPGNAYSQEKDGLIGYERRMRAFAFVVPFLVATASLGSFIDYEKREINVKLLYAGPADGPREATLRYIHSTTAPEARSKFLDLSLGKGRMLNFDFKPKALGEIRGFSVRFHLYSAVGGVKANDELAYKGADGIIFVALADPAAAAKNRAALAALKALVDDSNYEFESFTFVLQVEGTSDAGAADGVRRALGLNEVVTVPSDTAKGVGVYDALKGIAKLVLIQLRNGASQAKAPPAVEPAPELLPRDVCPEKDLESCTRQCEEKNAIACERLAGRVLLGRAGRADPARALELFTKGCTLGAPMSCTWAGLMWKSGKGAKPDGAKARTLFERGCELKSGPGCFNLATVLNEGVAGKRDAPGAHAAYVKACGFGEVDACANAGLMEVQGDGAKGLEGAGLKRLGKLCDEKGHGRACLDEAIAHEKGEGTKADTKAARDWYAKACNAGALEGCAHAARTTLLNSGPSVLPAARALAKKGCDGRDAKSCDMVKLLDVR